MNKYSYQIKLIEELCKKHDSSGRTNYCSGLFYKRRLVGIGYNNYLVSNRYQRRFKINKDSNYNHAEMDMLPSAFSLFNINKFERCICIVCRLSYNSLTKKYDRYISKPCNGCLRGLVHYGITNIIYYDGNNYKQERFRNV